MGAVVAGHGGRPCRQLAGPCCLLFSSTRPSISSRCPPSAGPRPTGARYLASDPSGSPHDCLCHRHRPRHPGERVLLRSRTLPHLLTAASGTIARSPRCSESVRLQRHLHRTGRAAGRPAPDPKPTRAAAAYGLNVEATLRMPPSSLPKCDAQVSSAGAARSTTS
jgi:hypothetical protein